VIRYTSQLGKPDGAQRYFQPEHILKDFSHAYVLVLIIVLFWTRFFRIINHHEGESDLSMISEVRRNQSYNDFVSRNFCKYFVYIDTL